MSTATLTATLPTLDDATRDTVRRNIQAAFGAQAGDTYWRTQRTQNSLWRGSVGADDMGTDPAAHVAGGYWNSAHALDIWNEAQNENAARQQQADERVPEPDEIDAMIRAEFPGPIPDVKLSKLRELIVASRETARLRDEVATLQRTLDDERRETRLSYARAAWVADDEGYCSTYDNIADRAGLPGRGEFTAEENEAARAAFRRDYRVRVRHVVEFDVSVEASSEDSAIDEVRDMSYAQQWDAAGEVTADDVIDETIVSATEED